jgi:3-dehydroquinate dehydratase-1
MPPLRFTPGSTLLVETVVTPAGLKALRRKTASADLAEVRVDALLRAGLSAAKVLAALRGRALPILLTCRLPTEGGVYPWKKGERAAVLRLLLPQVEAIDVELASRQELRAEIALARRMGKKLVLSAHALAKPASEATLRRWVKGMKRARPDVAKIAAHLADAGDLRRLARLLFDHPGQRWAVMGLGPRGPHSRQIFAALGSALVYGYLDKPAAPGQPSAKALRGCVRSWTA